MTSTLGRRAPGGPGIEPRWTHGAKVAVGTEYSTASRVWYTLDAGCVTEVYYPTIDTPQIRDLQFLFTDGKTFFHDERRNFTSAIDCISEAALGFEVTNREKEGRYTLRKTILGDPYQNCLLIHTRVEATAAGQAGKRHSIHFSLDARKSVGRQGLHSERATRRRSSKEQKESAQKKGARPARTHSRIKVSLRSRRNRSWHRSGRASASPREV
jgi:hypothetical protein